MKILSQITLFFLLSFQLLGQAFLPRSTPEAQGVSAKGIAEFIQAIEESEHELHSLMVLRNGRVIAEGWWEPYGPELRHTMYSVSKSFTATAVGFAVSEGQMTVNDKVVSFFPADLPATVSPYLSKLRIRDLLTMSVGHGKESTGEVVRSENWVRTFLNIPIDYPPGTRFMYNTAATYMLSAIVQKVTGETVLEYLQPRLFEPLGIDGADWEKDPQGINTGGYGLRLKTEDMAKFGQLFLQQGIWNGKQILPRKWIEEATTVKILQDPNASKEETAASDWLQGYGYQMWRSRHNSYRADGAFGQYILVLPEQDAVVVITSETPDMQGELDLVWEHILPAFENDTSLGADGMKNRLDGLSISPLESQVNSEREAGISGEIYEVTNPTAKDVEAFSVDFKENSCELTLVVGGEEHTFTFGSGKWVMGETERKGPYLVAGAKNYLEGLAPFKVAGSYAWMDESTLELQLRYIESPHTEIIRISFGEDAVLMNLNNSFNNNSKQLVFPAMVIEEATR